jgi:uracil-DNA glycosylase
VVATSSTIFCPLRSNDHESPLPARTGDCPGAAPCTAVNALELLIVAGRDLREVVEAGWAAALEPVAGRIAAMGDFLRAELAAGRRYLPAGENVLRAFKQPFGDVRVLIVGQDPYPTPGHAVGLSFSVPPQLKRLPPSLLNIFREYSADLGYPTPASGDLTRWTEHGVLLLNRVLTVRPGQPGSHRGRGWEEVTEQAIRALAARPSPLTAILWGRDARSLAPLLAGVPLIESAHPSPNSADRGFFGSRPFSRANALLEQQGAAPIDWKLL